MFLSYLALLLQGSQSSGRFLPRNSQLHREKVLQGKSGA